MCEWAQRYLDQEKTESNHCMLQFAHFSALSCFLSSLLTRTIVFSSVLKSSHIGNFFRCAFSRITNLSKPTVLLHPKTCIFYMQFLYLYHLQKKNKNIMSIVLDNNAQEYKYLHWLSIFASVKALGLLLNIKIKR